MYDTPGTRASSEGSLLDWTTNWGYGRCWIGANWKYGRYKTIVGLSCHGVGKKVRKEGKREAASKEGGSRSAGVGQSTIFFDERVGNISGVGQAAMRLMEALEKLEWIQVSTEPGSAEVGSWDWSFLLWIGLSSSRYAQHGGRTRRTRMESQVSSSERTWIGSRGGRNGGEDSEAGRSTAARECLPWIHLCG